MPRKSEPNPVVDVAAAVVAANPELRERLLRIYNKALDDVERVYRLGDVRDRAVYSRQLVPAMMRGMVEAEAGAVDDAMRDAFARMMKMMGGDGAEGE